MEIAPVKVSEAIQGIAALFLDTAPIIYLVEQNPLYLERIRSIFQRIDDGRISVWTTPVTLAECLVHSIRLGLAELQQNFDARLARVTKLKVIVVDELEPDDNPGAAMP